MSPWRQGLYLMWQYLGRGKSRPTAVVLAVGWGTLSMMLLLAFGEGLKNAFEEGRGGLTEANLVVLWPGTTTKAWQGNKPGRDIRFFDEDLQALKRSIPEIDQVAAERSAWSTSLAWGRNAITARVNGVFPSYERIRSHIAQPGGRFLNDEDMRLRRRVLFLGPELKTRLFGEKEAVGQAVLLRGVPFTVIGVMIEKRQMGMYGGPDVNKASIPITTYEATFGHAPYHNILYTVRPPAKPADIEDRVREVLAARQRFDPADKASVNFWDTVKMRDISDRIVIGLQAFLGIVGGMTLLVAGVGLANMLFVLVHRRTREIGMQMAIGAKPAVVTARTVGESLILAGIGGYVGIALAWLIVEGVQRLPIKSEAMQFLGKPTLSIPLGVITVLVLVGIGCLAGALPARRASRLNPVEALRHE